MLTWSRSLRMLSFPTGSGAGSGAGWLKTFFFRGDISFSLSLVRLLNSLRFLREVK